MTVIQKHHDFFSAAGTVAFGLTNDYMFKVVFSENQSALKGLICSLLHLSPDEVSFVEVMNPTIPGDSADSKDMIFDLKVTLNNNTLINMEMQVTKQEFWPERSLTYLCRTFNNLKEGESYLKVKPALHIGFLDFDLFPDEPEFYSTYHLANDKTHRIYTSKFTLSMVNLRQVTHATPEDIAYGIDQWAKFIKSTTWEEIQMLAKQNPAIAEAAQTMYQLSEDDLVRERCFSRQEHYRILQTYKEQSEEDRRVLQTYIEQSEEDKRILQSYKEQSEEDKRILQSYKEQNEENKRALQTYKEQSEEDKRIIQERDAEIARLKAELAAKSNK